MTLKLGTGPMVVDGNQVGYMIDGDVMPDAIIQPVHYVTKNGTPICETHEGIWRGTGNLKDTTCGRCERQVPASAFPASHPRGAFAAKYGKLMKPKVEVLDQFGQVVK